jgi:hypothetical protein
MTGMECILEVEPRAKGKTVWARMVTVESSGLRHNLTIWQEMTPAAARRLAKREAIRIVEVPANAN